ncbi:MAG: hypothetical protein LBB66_03355 [Desulfovibrio sp.]|jgi:hypothetical protein|nr:hypothetical protein [Desulfovibrio sp.]
MKLAVLGMACLGSFGFGVDALRERLASPLKPAFDDGRALCADTSGLKDIFSAKSLRHLDHFTCMALYAAVKALEDSGYRVNHDSDDCFEHAALVLATGYGPATPTFDFLNSIIANGDCLSSPLSFSRSVQNIPAASLAIRLGLTGSCATICQLDCPVAAAFHVAWIWLTEKRVNRVLLGAVDEHTPLLASTGKRVALGRSSKTGRRASLPLSEGAVFFCLERTSERTARRGCLEILPPGETSQPAVKLQGTHRVFCSGNIPRWAAALPHAALAEKAYGNLPVAQAFDIVLALDASTQPSLCVNFGEQGTIAAVRANSV